MSLRIRVQFYRRAMSYFRPDAPLIAVWLICLSTASGFGLLMAWPFAVLVDGVLAHQQNPDWIHRFFLRALPSATAGRILGLAAMTLFLKFGQDVVGAIQTVVSNQVNYAGSMRVRCDLFRKLQALNLNYHHTQPRGDAIYRLTNDTQGCQAILSVLVSGAMAALMLITMTSVLAARSFWLTATAFAVAPLLAWANLVFAGRFNRGTRRCREMDSKLTTGVERSLGSIQLMQAFSREQQEFDHFHATIRETIVACWRLNREQIIYGLLVGTLFGIGGATIFGVGGYLVYLGRLSIGDLIVFNSYLAMLWGPLCQLTGFAASMQSGITSTERVFEILDRDAEVADPSCPIELTQRPTRLELNDVTFGYDPKKPILKNLSISIESGQLVAFVGASGVGKSTLLNLLPRFYDPLKGNVRIDGIDARQLRLKDVRRNIALVSQDSILLPTTIAENIAYGRPDASRRQILEAAKLAGAASFIEDLPDGLNTAVAEGGANLSGGQRQRIAIARALLTEAPFIVLDEPSSALDTYHERLITKTLLALRGKRTVILVTHRLSTVRDCDQIFVLHDGAIAQRGTHAQLASLPGAYLQMLHARRRTTWRTPLKIAPNPRISAKAPSNKDTLPRVSPSMDEGL